MAKRINVILPEATISTIDRLVRPGQRSRFIQLALQARLKQSAIRDRDLDREIAADWFAVDQEQWQRLGKREKRQRMAGRKEVKSTSRRSTRP